ncbi:hypothetical protein HFN20_22840 [Paenibacillus dendritiformis]|nr:hypothetical protein [Paenibacillus dendritiformis]NKI24014.1 hypothetical protein [Paenibacillus dendritiformis]NRF96974.1 hypothetical protein [Paenibacillus dendritiformis]
MHAPSAGTWQARSRQEACRAAAGRCERCMDGLAGAMLAAAQASVN